MLKLICKITVLVVCAILSIGGFAATCAQADESLRFITRRGDQLFDGDKLFRFISFNIPNMLVVEDAFSFEHPNPWRWPDDFEIEDALESIRQIGGQVVRTYTISVFREGSDMGEVVHVRGPGQFNEEAFRTLDKVLEVAHRKGVRVIIPLVDNWKWMGGAPDYAHFRGKPFAAFWSDPEVIADFKKTIEYVLNRKNTLTGVAYRDEPAILGWETGNEIDATPEWTREIAAYIKQLDPNHLVFDGCSLHGVSKWQLEEPNTDVITTHHYPHGSPDFVPPIRAAHAETKGKKPYVVGEFGFVKEPKIAEVVNCVVDDGITGAPLWSLRFHRREGGFYWHMEVGTGGNFYKAYHWPGFESGAAYEEPQVMRLMHDQAYAIRGEKPPTPVPPNLPKLLPIENPAAISWQGSAGAAIYEIEVAPSSDGPWTIVADIADSVTDADVQYRPLYNYDKAEIGKPYYFRVRACNTAGRSAASNVVGPVQAKYRRFIDECNDTSRLASSTGSVKVTSENARRTQEDSARLLLTADDEAVYRVPGEIQAVRVYAFAPADDVRVDLAASADGNEFAPLKSKSESFASGQGEYGYFAPLLFESAVSDRGNSWLKVSIPSGGKDSAATTSASGGKNPPGVEISRVEIDFLPAN